MIRTLVAGGDHVGRTLAARLGRTDDSVVFVDDDPIIVDLAAEVGVTAHEADVTDVRRLRSLGVADPRTVVVATDEDGVNLLVAQLMRTAFDADRVVARVNDPRNRDVFERAGIETVCTAGTLASALEDVLETPVRRSESLDYRV